MVKIQAIICSALFLLGVADLLTTVVGVTAKGAIEVNPLFAALTQANIIAFIGLKFLAVLFTGVIFLGASRIANASSSNIVGKYFVTSASLASCFVMTAVVANNLLVILNIP
ncbi:MAG: DUF5658 family protein [Candidatus Bathyarchaeia archaeon]|jgi:hypothetical protein